MIEDPARPDKLLDLTRWNRAGLRRFAYVDGDAAVWLEELRIALMGLAARSADETERLPETWRNRFMDPEQWPAPSAQAAFAERLVWKDLYTDFPTRAETGGERSQRLLAQYAEQRGDYAWEIMRAFARAAHVLLAHQNAYANEGYLRTATQWDNLRRLAAMVNHQPAPPSSATTTVGLIVDPAQEPAEIPRGLAMKYTPPEGGAPIVFETLKPLRTHPDLNAARAQFWDRDPSALKLASDIWLAEEEAVLAPGGLAVLARISGKGAVSSATIAEADHDPDAGLATLRLDGVKTAWTRSDAVLHIEPKDARRALPRKTDDTLVLKIDTAASYSISSIVRLHVGSSPKHLKVTGNADGHLKLAYSSTLASSAEVEVEAMVPHSSDGGQILTAETSGLQLFFVDLDGLVQTVSGFKQPIKDGGETVGTLGNLFTDLKNTTGPGYAPAAGCPPGIGGRRR